MKVNPIPVLITWDIDPDRWATIEQRQLALSMALDLCEEFSIRSTFFITANFIHEYPKQLERMNFLNQEIACHGLMHSDEEDYDRMPENLQKVFITDAAQKIENVIGSPVKTFRSPRVKTSATTLKLLSDHNYRTDSSVCSQRMDFVSSNLINFGWLVAPRLPYHPNQSNPFRKGNLPILEIPISAIMLPFISSSLKVLGLQIMKLIFRLLYTEARISGKPIVYLAHPTEFIYDGNPRKINLRDFSPQRVRTHGFLARNFLFRLQGQSLYYATRELFGYISSMPGIKFLTCNEFTCQFNPETGRVYPETT